MQAAVTERTDLITMSTHGCGVAEGGVFGSVGEAVLKMALVPVLLVRAVRLGERGARAATEAP